MTTIAADTTHLSPHDRQIGKSGIFVRKPFVWVGQGIADFTRIPGLSLLYSVLFAGLCAGIFYLTRNVPWYTVAYITSLAFAGPFLASGLYATSRDMSRGVRPTLTGSVGLISKRKTYLGLFALMLTLVMAAWVRFSALIFALTHNVFTPNANILNLSSLGQDGMVAIAYGAGVGLLLAVAVFTVSAFAIPRILDRDSDFISSMGYSARKVAENLPAMAVWAAIIVALTAVGIATAFIGFAIIFPVLGYATWHSYKSVAE